MGSVQRAVFRLNEPEKLDAFLRELGRKHVAYGANVEYIDVSTLYLSLSLPLSSVTLSTASARIEIHSIRPRTMIDLSLILILFFQFQRK